MRLLPFHILVGLLQEMLCAEYLLVQLTKHDKVENRQPGMRWFRNLNAEKPAPQACLDQPTQTGLCRAHFKKWRFDQKKQVCEQFTYGGCGKTANFFLSQEDCQRDCLSGNVAKEAFRVLKEQDKKPQSCLDTPSETGMCKARFLSVRYIIESDKCEEFVYGGCQATLNIFQNMEECRKECVSRAPVKEVLGQNRKPQSCLDKPSERGGCRAMPMRRFRYIIESDKCEEFEYGGCWATLNMFRSMEECKKECQSFPRPSANTGHGFRFGDDDNNDDDYDDDGGGGHDQSVDARLASKFILEWKIRCFGTPPQRRAACGEMGGRGWIYQLGRDRCKRRRRRKCHRNKMLFGSRRQCEQACGVPRKSPAASDMPTYGALRWG